jgi:hypothetical protein
MELVVEPDVYIPNIDENGNYVDKIYITNKNEGIHCPCSRKDRIYNFSQHMKSKCHQQWIKTINLNKANHFMENMELRNIVSNQKLIIAKMEKELTAKMIIIDCLSQQLVKEMNTKIVDNLLEFD